MIGKRDGRLTRSRSLWGADPSTDSGQEDVPEAV